jgi:hypothetical protein
VISKSPEPISRGIIDSSYGPDKLPGKRIAGWQAAKPSGYRSAERRISQIGKLSLTIANMFDLAYHLNTVRAARRALGDGVWNHP